MKYVNYYLLRHSLAPCTLRAAQANKFYEILTVTFWKLKMKIYFYQLGINFALLSRQGFNVGYTILSPCW